MQKHKYKGRISRQVIVKICRRVARHRVVMRCLNKIASIICKLTGAELTEKRCGKKGFEDLIDLRSFRESLSCDDKREWDHVIFPLVEGARPAIKLGDWFLIISSFVGSAKAAGYFRQPRNREETFVLSGFSQIELCPEDSLPNKISYVRWMAENGDGRKALELARELFNENPKVYSVIVLLYELAKNEGDDTSAELALRRSEWLRKTPAGSFELGRFLLNRRKFRQAEQVFSNTPPLAFPELDPEVSQALAACIFEAGTETDLQAAFESVDLQQIPLSGLIARFDGLMRVLHAVASVERFGFMESRSADDGWTFPVSKLKGLRKLLLKEQAKLDHVITFLYGHSKDLIFRTPGEAAMLLKKRRNFLDWSERRDWVLHCAKVIDGELEKCSGLRDFVRACEGPLQLIERKDYNGKYWRESNECNMDSVGGSVVMAEMGSIVVKGIDVYVDGEIVRPSFYNSNLQNYGNRSLKDSDLAENEILDLEDCIVLLANDTFGKTNYYHFLHLTLPRMIAVAKRLPKYKMLISFDAAPWVRGILDGYPILKDRIIEIDPNRYYRIKDGFLVDCSDGSCDLSGEFLRGELKGGDYYGRATEKGKKLFIKRNVNVSRQLINLAEVEQCFINRGFEALVPEEMSFIEQAATFRDAEMVAGVCGAWMANLVFCLPGVNVIALNKPEIFGFEFVDLAIAGGLKYRWLFGETPHALMRGFVNPIPLPFTVPVEKLETVLESL